MWTLQKERMLEHSRWLPSTFPPHLIALPYFFFFFSPLWLQKSCYAGKFWCSLCPHISLWPSQTMKPCSKIYNNNDNNLKVTFSCEGATELTYFKAVQWNKQTNNNKTLQTMLTLQIMLGVLWLRRWCSLFIHRRSFLSRWIFCVRSFLDAECPPAFMNRLCPEVQGWAGLWRFFLHLFLLLISFCAVFNIVFLHLSSGYRLHYSRRAESCGSVNYLHLCSKDEQVSDMQKAAIRENTAKGKCLLGRRLKESY